MKTQKQKSLQKALKTQPAATTHKLTLLSYNLRFHTAYSEVEALTTNYPLDIICLQECHTDKLFDQISNLVLAAKTEIGELGLAIYCSKRFQVVHSYTRPLPLSLSEQLHPKSRVRLLVAELRDTVNGSQAFVGCLHATHLIASNRLRRQQLRYAFNTLNESCGDTPVILAGDYNYPLFHHRLREFVEQNNYQLTAGDQPTYKARIFAGKYDFASVRNVQSAEAVVLPQQGSDHMPVLITVTI